MKLHQTHVYKAGITIIPGHGQLDVGVVAPIDPTFLQAQVQGTFPDCVVLKKILVKCHGYGGDPALD